MVVVVVEEAIVLAVGVKDTIALIWRLHFNNKKCSHIELQVRHVSVIPAGKEQRHLSVFVYLVV